MKYYLSFLILILTLPVLNAQSFSFSPSTELNSQLVLEEYQIFQININNETEESLQLVWRLNADNMAEGWTYSLCDNSTCYGTIPANATMNPIVGDEYAFLKIDVNPNSVESVGSLEFIVHEEGNPGDYEIVVFNFNSISTGIVEVLTDKVKAYPNPVSSLLNIDNLSDQNLTFQICNILGKVVMASELLADSNSYVDVSNLQNGIYLLSYSAGDRIHTRKIKVQH